MGMYVCSVRTYMCIFIHIHVCTHTSYYNTRFKQYNDQQNDVLFLKEARGGCLSLFFAKAQGLPWGFQVFSQANGLEECFLVGNGLENIWKSTGSTLTDHNGDTEDEYVFKWVSSQKWLGTIRYFMDPIHKKKYQHALYAFRPEAWQWGSSHRGYEFYTWDRQGSLWVEIQTIDRHWYEVIPSPYYKTLEPG